MTAARRWPRRLLRALARCLLLLAALLVTLLLAACLYLSTAGGKDRLLQALLSELNQVLAGSISVQRIQQLRPTSIVLEDVVLSAPAGNQLLKVHELRAELALAPLLHGQLILPRLSLETGALDLRLLDHPSAGLLSALATRGDAQPAPARSGPPPSVVIGALELRDWRVTLPESAAWSPSELQVSTLRASVTAATVLDLELERFEAEVGRGGTSLGRVGLRGHASTEVDSRFELTSSLCGTETDLELKLGSSHSRLAEWQDLPFDLRLRQRDLTASRLADLANDPSLQSLFPGALASELLLQGSARHWQAQAQLALEAGRLSISVDGSALDTLELTLQTERLELQPLIPGAPDWRLGAQLRASARRLPERPALAIQLSTRLVLNEVALPPLELRAELEPGALRRIDLQLADRWLALSAQGDLALDGTAQVRARGHLQIEPLLRTLRAFGLAPALEQRLRPANGSLSLELELARKRSGALHARGILRSPALELADTRLAELTAKLAVDGSLPQPALHADVRWAAVRRGSLELTPSHLRVEGEPGRYAFDLQGGSPSFGSFAASGWLEPRARESRFLVKASGALAGASWQLGMDPALRTGAGSLLLPDVHLEFAGQRVSLHGQYSPRACDLVLEFAHLDLLQLLTPLDPRLARAGLLTGKLQARGAPEHPELELELAGEGLALAPGPKLTASVQAQLDPTRGALLVQAHLGTGLNAAAPRRLDLVWRVQDDQAGRVDTELKLEDEAGPWIHLLGHLAFARARSGPWHLPELLLALPSASARALEHERWQLELSAEPRPLGRLPLPAGWARLGAFALGARLVAEHQAGAEPTGKLDVRVTDTAQQHQSGPCATRALSSQGSLAFARGRFDAELTARADDVSLLEVTTSGAFEWAAWLSGQVPRLPELQAVFAAHQLPLATLPFVCDRAQGELTLNGRVRNSLDKGLDAELEVGLARFSLGSDQTVEAAGTLRANPAEIVWSGSVKAAERTSRFAGRLQQRAPGADPALWPQRRVDASLDFDQLPLAPFFPLQGPISHVSGSLSGQTRVDGSQPTTRLSGSVELHDVAFTATALAQPLNGINGKLRLEDEALVLDHLSAHDASGDLVLDGRVTLQKPRGFRAGLDLNIRKFPLRQSGQLLAASSANARIDIDWRPGEQNLRLQLHDANIWLESGTPPEGLALEPHPDLVVMRGPSRAPPGAGAEPLPQQSDANTNSSSTPNRMLIEIECPEGFRIERADFAFKLSTQLKILVQRPAPTPGTSGVSVSGEIRFVRGYMELLGKMFEIQAGGTLRFAGNNSTTLDLVARYQDRRSEKLVKVHLRGTASSPKLDFSVDDAPISAGEAFQVIYGSESSEDRLEDTEAQAKEVVSALTAGVITTSIRRRLGAIAPIVALDPADSEGVGQVRAGFELDTLIPTFLDGIVTSIYVEGILATEKTAEQGGERDVQPGVLIELHFPYNLVTSGRYGPDATWALDLGWQLEVRR